MSPHITHIFEYSVYRYIYIFRGTISTCVHSEGKSGVGVTV